MLLALALGGCSVEALPLTENELSLSAGSQLVQVTADQEPVTRDITLYEAMARAVKYNLDHRVKLFEARLADQKVNVARSDMLPDLVANAQYSDRNNDPFAFSRSITGVPSANPSVSREKESRTNDLTFSWHILDFGLSYVRAKQASDNALIAEENKRKVMNQIMEQVRTAYWRAVSADRLLNGFQKLEKRINRALVNSGKLQKQGLTSPIAALTYQRELVDIKRQIQRLERELKSAKVELAALMNLGPSNPYKLVIPKRKLNALKLTVPSEEMTWLALLNRPEIRELQYAKRINEREAEIALLELLPGLQLYSGLNYDSNSFLLNSDWVSWGAKASWNAMKVFTYPVKKRLIKSETSLIKMRGLAMTMAIMTQVEVAKANYHYLQKLAKTSSDYHRIQRQILVKTRSSAKVNAASEQTLIREEMNSLIASAQFDIAYAELQNAFARIFTTIGVDPYGEDFDPSASVTTVTASLKQTWNARGDRAQ
jgi:outer membrane protein TolC